MDDLPDLTGAPWQRKDQRRPAPTLYRCVLCPARAAAWDHCHTHDVIRGPLCTQHNRAMCVMDAGMVAVDSLDYGGATGADLLAYRARCPDCLPGAPPLAQWRIDFEARTHLGARLTALGAPRACSRCAVVQQLHGVPAASSRDHARQLRDACQALNAAAEGASWST